MILPHSVLVFPLCRVGEPRQLLVVRALLAPELRYVVGVVPLLIWEDVHVTPLSLDCGRLYIDPMLLLVRT